MQTARMANNSHSALDLKTGGPGVKSPVRYSDLSTIETS